MTRRGGPDVVCASDEAHQQCENLFQRMKQVALPAFGVEDDLLSMPHSVLVKIQFGGLLGLQRLQGNGTAESSRGKEYPWSRWPSHRKTWRSRRHPLPGVCGGDDLLQAQTPAMTELTVTLFYLLSLFSLPSASLFTESSSISKISTSFGPMAAPAPRGP